MNKIITLYIDISIVYIIQRYSYLNYVSKDSCYFYFLISYLSVLENCGYQKKIPNIELSYIVDTIVRFFSPGTVYLCNIIFIYSKKNIRV